MARGRVLLSAATWLALLSLSGCNAGVGAVLLAIFLDDDDGSSGRTRSDPLTLSSIEFVGLENARTRPAETMVRVRLTNAAGVATRLLVEYDDLEADAGFRPATLIPPLPGDLGDPGELNGVAGSEEGRLHRIGWDAQGDVLTDGLRNVRLRFSGDLADVVLADVVVGNDPPEIVELTVRQRPAELAEVTLDLKDSSSDPVDVMVEFAAPALEIGQAPLFLPATTEGVIELLRSGPDGFERTFLWDSIADLGPLDRPAILRVTPTDRVDGGPGKTGLARQRQIFSNGNRAPVGLLLEEEVLTNPDARRGIALGFTLEDKESNPVDVILQWEDDDHPFPELPEGLERDPDGREMVLSDPVERASLQVVSLLEERVTGVVEQPAEATMLADNELLASWLLVREPLRGVRVDEALSGRRVRVVGGDEVRRICGYSSTDGILRLDAPFAAPPEPGASVAITFGGPLGTLRMRTSPETLVHRVVWDAATDAPGGGTIRFRLTPYDRVAVEEDDPCGDLIQTPDSQVFRGAVGTTSATSGAKRVRGPFRAMDPWVVALAPVDAPAVVEAADVDGDGSLDFVYGARLSNAVVVLRQTVPGEFEALRLLDETLAGPSGLAVRDLDGDGDVDIAVTGEDSGTLRVWLQEPGLDFFSNRPLLATGDALGRPNGLVAADFDSNGTADLAVTSASGELQGLAVFFRGEKGWDPPVHAGLGTDLEPLALDASDITGDGRLDLAVAGYGFVAVCAQQADGGFSEGVVRAEAPGAELGAVTVVDLNLDGRPDLLVVDREGGGVLAAFQDGEGAFTLAPVVEEAELQDPRSIVAADFDRDGHVDFAVGDAGSSISALGGEVSVFVAAAGGRFQRDNLRRLPEVGGEAPSPQAILAVDVDGDGVLELVSAEARVEEIAVYFQGVAGSFRDRGQEIVGAPTVGAPATLLAADLSGDGRKDLFTTHTESGQLTVVRQGIGGQFVALRVPLAEDSAVSGPVAVDAGDVDGDGRADLVVANRDSNSVSVLFGTADGGFLETAVSATGLLGLLSVALGDLDGDGRLDLVAAGDQGGLRWFRQRPTGPSLPPPKGEEGSGDQPLFEVGSGLAVPAEVSSDRATIALGDWDGDGRLDVLAVLAAAERFAIFLQTTEESGAFDDPELVELREGSDPGGFALGDIDGDGRLDAVVSGRGDGSVSLLLQQSDGAVELKPLVAPGDAVATDVAVGDVNRDGRMDVVAALVGTERSALRLLLQGTESDFSDAGRRDLESPLALGPVALVLEDLDGDGELDVTSANRLSATVTAFFGGR